MAALPRWPPLARLQRIFAPRPAPPKLQEALPFASKPKLAQKRNPNGYLAKRERAVVIDGAERKYRQMMQARLSSRAFVVRFVAQAFPPDCDRIALRSEPTPPQTLEPTVLADEMNL